MRILLHQVPRAAKLPEVEWWLPGAHGRGWGGESVFSRYRVPIWEDENILEMASCSECTV